MREPRAIVGACTFFFLFLAGLRARGWFVFLLLAGVILMVQSLFGVCRGAAFFFMRGRRDGCNGFVGFSDGDNDVGGF